MTHQADLLRSWTGEMFIAAGCPEKEAEAVATNLVDSNLAGHDSHGVIRVPSYVQWLREGKVLADRRLRIVTDSGPVVVADGEFGLGQSIGIQAMELGIRRAATQGVCVLALRNSGHLGRIGAWAEMATAAGQISLHWVNTSGAGILVAPHGGIDRRLSANPVAAGIPRSGGPPVVMDMSACTIAEGKIRVARNSGKQLPEDCIIDGMGRPTTDPHVFYGDPGAILSIAGHKGFALGMVCELLAGALTGSSCSHPELADRVVNGMLTILLDRGHYGSVPDFDREVTRFVEYVRSSRPIVPGGDILMPGEPEARSREQRLRHGIEVDATTWAMFVETGNSLGVHVT